MKIRGTPKELLLSNKEPVESKLLLWLEFFLLKPYRILFFLYVSSESKNTISFKSNDSGKARLNL